MLILTSSLFVLFNCFIFLLVFRIQCLDLYKFIGKTNFGEPRDKVSSSRLLFDKRSNVISFNVVKLVREINEN